MSEPEHISCILGRVFAELEKQYARTIQDKRDELKHLSQLMKLRVFLENKITPEFNPVLSSQLDCINYLIDTLGAQSSDSCGGALTTSGAPSLSGREDVEQQHLQG